MGWVKLFLTLNTPIVFTIILLCFKCLVIIHYFIVIFFLAPVITKNILS